MIIDVISSVTNKQRPPNPSTAQPKLCLRPPAAAADHREQRKTHSSTIMTTAKIEMNKKKMKTIKQLKAVTGKIIWHHEYRGKKNDDNNRKKNDNSNNRRDILRKQKQRPPNPSPAQALPCLRALAAAAPAHQEQRKTRKRAMTTVIRLKKSEKPTQPILTLVGQQ